MAGLNQPIVRYRCFGVFALFIKFVGLVESGGNFAGRKPNCSERKDNKGDADDPLLTKAPRFSVRASEP